MYCLVRSTLMKCQYARIDHYGRLLVPIKLLEKIAAECYVCETEYKDGNHVLSDIERIRKVDLMSAEEVENMLMYKELSE